MTTLIIIFLLMYFVSRLQKIYAVDTKRPDMPLLDSEESRKKKEALEERLRADAEYIQRLHKEDEIAKAYSARRKELR